MSKAVLIHLSDIHVKTEHDTVLSRADAIAASVQDFQLGVDACIVVVSGDLAYSGQESQYLAAWQFLDDLKTNLCRRLVPIENQPQVPVYTVVIPGNHDCNFSGTTDIRSLIISSILDDTSRANTEAFIDECLKVQDPFFDAMAAFGSPPSVLIKERHERLAFEYLIPIANESLRLLCFNSACLSEIHETQGRLYLPPSLVPTTRPSGSLVAALFHHPYNWYPSDPSRELRHRIEAVADLILTGHEHEATIRSQQVSTGERNTLVEGGVLQETGNPDSSYFNAFVLDLTALKQKMARLEWNGSMYVPLGLVDSTGGRVQPDWEELPTTRLREHGAFRVSDSMRQHLDDLGIPIRHKSRELLKLSDVFMYPELQEVLYPDTSQVHLIRSTDVANLLREAPRILILGESESGKSTLAKRAFGLLLDSSYIPLLVNGKVRPQIGDRLVNYLLELFSAQYDSGAQEAYLQIDRSSRVIIVDDYDKLPLSAEQKKAFLQGITDFAGRVVLFSNGLIQEANDIVRPVGSTDAVTPFAKYRIMPMGRLLRSDFVENWLLLDRDAANDIVKFVYRRQEIIRTLDTLTASNRLPRYPLFVLTVLYGTEIASTMDTQVGTHGAYYEILIRAALGKYATPVEFNIRIEYLAHFAYRLFDDNTRSVDRATFGRIHRDYEKKYEIDLDAESMLGDLSLSLILEDSIGGIKFKHRYFYYYFVASWLRDHMDEERVRHQISQLTRAVDIEEYANILMFLAHLSRDPLIIDEMLRAAKSSIADLSSMSMKDDVTFFQALETGERSREFVDSDTEENHRKMLSEMDDRAREVATFDEPSVEVVPLLSEHDEIELEPIAELNSAIKTVEILGQVLRNFPGNLTGERKLEIARETYALGLRSLSLVYELLWIGGEDLLDLFTDVAQVRDDSLTRLQAQQIARNILVGLAEAIGTSLIRFVSNSVGSTELERTYARLEAERAEPSVRLINTSIRMDFTSNFPEDRVIQMSRDFARLPLAKSVLQQLVVLHFHLFPTPMGTKQKVCAALGIKYNNVIGANPHLKVIGS